MASVMKELIVLILGIWEGEGGHLSIFQFFRKLILV